MHRADNRGFTLVEVMVALLVVAVALPALLVSLYRQVDATAYVRDKSLAHMVAANKLTEVRLLAAARETLPSGSESGVATMAGREWHWWLRSEETEVQQFRRISVVVAAGPGLRDRPLYTLVAFMSADLASDPEPEQAGEQNPGGNETDPDSRPPDADRGSPEDVDV